MFTEPNDPPQGATKMQEQIWEKEVDEFVKRKGYFEENLKTLYSLVWGQCTNVMQQKVEAMTTFATISSKGDGLALIKAIRDLPTNSKARSTCHMPYMSQCDVFTCVCKASMQPRKLILVSNFKM